MQNKAKLFVAVCYTIPAVATGIAVAGVNSVNNVRIVQSYPPKPKDDFRTHVAFYGAPLLFGAVFPLIKGMFYGAGWPISRWAFEHDRALGIHSRHLVCNLFLTSQSQLFDDYKHVPIIGLQS